MPAGFGDDEVETEIGERQAIGFNLVEGDTAAVVAGGLQAFADGVDPIGSGIEGDHGEVGASGQSSGEVATVQSQDQGKPTGMWLLGEPLVEGGRQIGDRRVGGRRGLGRVRIG